MVARLARDRVIDIVEIVFARSLLVNFVSVCVKRSTSLRTLMNAYLSRESLVATNVRGRSVGRHLHIASLHSKLSSDHHKM